VILYQTERPEGHPFSGQFLVFFSLALAGSSLHGHAGADRAKAIDTHCQIFSFEAVSSPAQWQTESARSNTAFTGVGMEFYPLGLEPDMSGVVLHEAGHMSRNAHWTFLDVYNPYWRLIYDWRPGHKILRGDREISLGPDHLVLHPGHVHCDFRGEAPVPTTWLHFSYKHRPDLSQEVPFDLKPAETELRLLRELSGIFREREAQVRQRVFSLSLALLQVVLSRPGLRWLEETPPAISRVTEYVREHFAEPHYNDSLARQAGVSTRVLTRLFRKHLGVSPARFVAQVRMREAAYRLANTPLGLEVIAEQTGFPNGAYFSRAFKQYTGLYPMLFRQRRIAVPPSL
jgi:AraC family transcriptional regulator, arabinose operon regulatory protein